MSGRDQTLNAYTFAPPAWCGDFLGRDQLLPGGVKLDATAWGTYVDVPVTVTYATAQAGPIGTGNGTLTAVSTGANANSTGEVFTLTATDATHFNVVGSLSGNIGVATVGVPFVSTNVSFTINAGGTAFVAGDHFTITTTGATAGATALPVAALANAIAPGSTLNFGIPGLVATTEAGAAQNATSIVVAPLDRAIPNGSTYLVPGDTHKNVPSGTVIGRTYVERDAAGLFGPVADGDEEIYLIAFDVVNLDRINDAAVVRSNAGVVVKENFLPGFSGLTNTQKGYVRARYICVQGAP
jgi:hypothetical protein